MAFEIDSRRWAEQQFGACNLHDQRRTKRLIQVAEQVAQHPAGSLPQQFQSWGDLKAAYRLFHAEEATWEAIAGPHWRQTRATSPGRYLVLADTTEIDFGGRRQVPELSRIGNGSGLGFLVHSALMVEATSKEVLGVAGQCVHYRRAARRKENDSQRFQRERESHVWGDVIDRVGAPPEGSQWVHVCDRDADDFEVFCHLIDNRCDWVIRASAPHRLILTPDGGKMSLQQFLPSLLLVGAYELSLRARPQQPARTAKLEVRVGTMHMPIPRHTSPYVKRRTPEPIPMNVVWVRETDAPAGVDPITWVLYTSLPVHSFEQAWLVVESYECRWLIEEYHKSIKSGCSVERRLLQSAHGLEAVAALLSVVAVRLLQLKMVARLDSNRPARNVVPPLWLTMLKAVRKRLTRVHDLTIYQFYRELAKLGGFLGRKSDGEPGWITIWRGWERLNALVLGAELAREL
jgi:hypothetical protein